jgi:hypothetical protein
MRVGEGEKVGVEEKVSSREGGAFCKARCAGSLGIKLM